MTRRKVDRMSDLAQLLEQVALLFVHKPEARKPHLTSFDFQLCKFPYGWVFKVVNDWNKWSRLSLVSQFGAYERPESAVKAFLAYVEENNLDVKSLMDDDRI